MLLKTQISERALHSEIHRDMLCPLSGKVEPMILQLYEREIRHPFYTRIEARPMVCFYRQVVAGERDDIQIDSTEPTYTKEEIPSRYWTKEMIKVEQVAVKGNSPLPNTMFRLSLLGRLLSLSLLLLIGSLGYYLFISFWGV